MNERLTASADAQRAAVIMAGGRGKRLGPLTDTIPKPMLAVGGRPILERIVLHVVGHGIRRIHLSVNYRAEMIEQHFGDGSDFGCSISYVREDPDHPLGAAGSLSLLGAQGFAPTKPLLVMNGDIMTELSIDALLRHHASSRADITVAVKDYSYQVPSGVVVTDAEGDIIRIDEKPTVSWPVAVGVYVLEPKVLSDLPAQTPMDFPDLAKRALARGARATSWEIDSDWIDIGQPDDLRRARGEAL